MYRDRLYGPAEVRQILRRAAEIQDQEGEPMSGGSPMTRAEIEKLAADAGITKEAVARAMEAGSAPEAPMETSVWTGGPSRIVLERTIDGMVGKSEHAALVNMIRRSIGDGGLTEVLGDSLMWRPAQAGGSGQMGGRQLHVTIVPEDGRTTLRIEERFHMLMGQLFGGVLGGVGGGGLGLVIPLLAGFSRSPVVWLTALCGWLGFVFLLTRSLYRARVEARHAELTALLDELAARAGRGLLRAAGPNVRISARKKEAGSALEDAREIAEAEAEMEAELGRDARRKGV